MAKKINVKNIQSSGWEGLWYHPDEHRYTSTVLDLSGLRDYKGSVIFSMVKNRSKKKGDNRPSYLFRISGLEADASKEVIFENGYKKSDRTWITVEDAARIATNVAMNTIGSDEAFEMFYAEVFCGCESATDDVFVRYSDEDQQ